MSSERNHLADLTGAVLTEIRAVMVERSAAVLSDPETSVRAGLLEYGEPFGMTVYATTGPATTPAGAAGWTGKVRSRCHGRVVAWSDADGCHVRHCGWFEDMDDCGRYPDLTTVFKNKATCR